MLTQQQLDLVGDWQCGLSTGEVALKNSCTVHAVNHAVDIYMTVSAVIPEEDER